MPLSVGDNLHSTLYLHGSC